MRGKFWRKALAAALALLVVSGNVPIKPVADLFGGTAITASAIREYDYFLVINGNPENPTELNEGDVLELHEGDCFEIYNRDGDGWGGFGASLNVPFTGEVRTFGVGGIGFDVAQSGFYVFTLTDKGDGNWFVSVLRSMNNCTVSDIPAQTYTGSAIEPEITVTDGEKTLTLGTDYVVTYSDNTNAGTAKATITGKGNYGGTIVKTFAINNNKADLTVTPAENLVYTGEAQNLVKGDVPEGTEFSFTEPISVVDYDSEKDLISPWMTEFNEKKNAAFVDERDSEFYYYSAAEYALIKYSEAIDFLKNGNESEASFALADAKEYAVDMPGCGVTPSSDDSDAINYIQEHIVGEDFEAFKARFEDDSTNWLTTAEATNAGDYTVWYKGDGVNYDDTVKSFTVTIAKAPVTVTPAENLVYTGEAQNLVDGDVPEGTMFSFEAPIVFDAAAEDKKIGELLETLDDCGVSASGYEAEFYNAAYSALGCYRYAISVFANTGNASIDVIEDTNNYISYMDDIDINHVIVPADEAEEALEYINTYVRGLTAEKLEERCKTVEPNWNTTAEATNAGTYTVYYKGDGENYDDTVKNFTVTIGKAPVTVTPAENLVYTGKAQKLVDGDVPEGTKFSFENPNDIETEPNWLDTAEATNAGTYTVWYKGDGVNYSDEIKSFDVTIARADLPVNVTGYEGTFDGNAHGISVDVGNSDAVVYYARESLNADNYADIGKTESPSFTNAGNYRVYYYVTTGNYDPNPVSGSILVTIKKADAPALTDDQKPTPVDKLVYTGEALDLVTAPENTPDGYSIRYSINGGAWISTLPTAVESGTYTVAYKYVENANYKDIAGETFTITVKDKYTEPMWVWADDYSSATATFIKNDNTSEPIILDAEVTSEVVSEPTYTEYGKTVYIATVKLEGKTYTYRKPVITAKLSLTHVEAVPATCDEAGNIEYWFDAENEKYFADDKGKTEITKADTIVAPIDHAYGEAQWIWNAENAATATFKCANCGDEQVVNAVVTAEVTAPTYTKNGKTVYTATVNFEGETYTDTLTVTIGKKAYTAPAISYLKGDGAVKLSWNAIEGAERYAIAGFIDGKWKLLNRTEDTSFIIDNLNPGEQYKVAVVAMFDGEYIMDFSNAIVVTPKPAQEVVYPKITEIEYNEQYHQFKLNWTEVPNAQNYGIAVYLAGKWKIQTQSIPATQTSYTSPKLKAGQTYKMIVCAKVNGKWDLSALNSRAFEVTVK